MKKNQINTSLHILELIIFLEWDLKYICKYINLNYIKYILNYIYINLNKHEKDMITST